SGNLSAGGVLQLGQVNVAGMACYPNGLISRDANGGVLSCQSGAWQASNSGRYVEMGVWETTSTRGVTYQIPGAHKYCLVS
ncbi:shufflon system plasmid conjugative transfer pilus tip adhesin PilV, partial [Enterobacter hormaechei]|uniref:shufflon system plasmid conjugative transfer pilus tip adhesin PilV n=7 Tax=Enterobacter TaxID=547 RepID=UPI0013FDC95B